MFAEEILLKVQAKCLQEPRFFWRRKKRMPPAGTVPRGLGKLGGSSSASLVLQDEAGAA